MTVICSAVEAPVQKTGNDQRDFGVSEITSGDEALSACDAAVVVAPLLQ